ncbi:MAG TPA: DUF6298 domain-containing protein [Pyrinomonadaceae bacterium]|jgi:hypothetical protein
MRRAHDPVRTILAATLISMAFIPAIAPKAQRLAPSDVKIDFSYAGYEAGGASPPLVPAVLRVRPSGGDDTALLQAALDRVASGPLRADGFRGALQLSGGRFRVGGQLLLRASGIVLRGSTDKSSPTVIVATGLGRRTLIEVGREQAPAPGKEVRVTDALVPSGSRTLSVESVAGFGVGNRVVITRPSTKEWIAALGMNKAEGPFADQRTHWLPGSRNLVWDRTVVAVDAARKQLALDAPITTALEERYGGGQVARVLSNEPVERVGIEHLTLESEYYTANPRDEEHSWIAVALDNTEDAWVRNVVARHFAGSAVRVGRRARRLTIEDCRSEQPVSEIGGYRRQSFLVEGQQVLVRGCYGEAGLNDFASGFCAGGPNVFLDCSARGALGPSGSFESWSSGVLYERVRVEGAALRLTYDMKLAQGGGWTAANSVVWNSTAKEIEARGPEDAPNIASTSQEPLYETQLAKRLGAAAHRPGTEIKPAPPASSAKLTSIPEFRPTRTARSKQTAAGHPLSIIGGRFVIDGRVIWGGMLNAAWWKGQVSEAVAQQASGVSLTRFVPGRTGPGLTEDLPRLAERMLAQGMLFFNGGPGLWYDRRRDEHSITKREDGNVWAPFYEMPWARSGRGVAWDGLSLYDLTRFNPWYFERTREFASLCNERGLVYYHSLYNTHNLLETTAHWVDFPWRPANNTNDTGLPEPPPIEEKNTIHVANQFYDVGEARRRALHRAYILKTLDELGPQPNIIFIPAFQYAGPAGFQQFFLQTVAEWERAKRRKVRVALVASKDVTDAVLSDPALERQIAIIDMRYWQYRPDGSLWAPKGGQNLAFREMITKDFGRSGDTPPPTTPAQLYRQVREYRDRFPAKAVVAWHSGVGPIPILMAGGAQALMRNPASGQSQGIETDRTSLDAFVREYLSDVLMRMRPQDAMLEEGARNWALSDEGSEAVLFYSLSGPGVTLARSLPSKGFSGIWFDPRTGKTSPLVLPPSLDKGTTIQKPSEADWLLLLRARR